MALIARYFHLEEPDISVQGQGVDEVIEEALQVTNMPTRNVRLTGEWWKDGDGPLLAKTSDGSGAIALFPGAVSGLYFRDVSTGKKVRVTKENAVLFGEDALCFYQPLPARPMTGGEYLAFLLHQIKLGDIALYTISSIFLSVGGIVTSLAVKIAFDRIIPTREIPLLLSLFLFLISLAVATYFNRTARQSLNLRIQNRLDVVVESGIMARMLNLPVSFFGENTAGGLSQRVLALNDLPKTIADSLFVVSNTVVSILVVLPVAFIAPELLPAALGAIALVHANMSETRYQVLRFTRLPFARKRRAKGFETQKETYHRT